MDYAAIIYDSAKKKPIKLLDPIQNIALRVSLGAFRTSPATSITAEAAMVPRDIKRKELCLKYTATIKTTPSNPAFHCVIKDFLISIYTNNQKIPQPLRIRTNSYLNETSVS